MALATNWLNPRVGILHSGDNEQEKLIRLRCLWTLHDTGNLSEELALRLGLNKEQDEYIRAWTIQLTCEDKKPSEALLQEFARMASASTWTFRNAKAPVTWASTARTSSTSMTNGRKC